MSNGENLMIVCMKRGCRGRDRSQAEAEQATRSVAPGRIRTRPLPSTATVRLRRIAARVPEAWCRLLCRSLGALAGLPGDPPVRNGRPVTERRSVAGLALPDLSLLPRG